MQRIAVVVRFFQPCDVLVGQTDLGVERGQQALVIRLVFHDAVPVHGRKGRCGGALAESRLAAFVKPEIILNVVYRLRACGQSFASPTVDGQIPPGRPLDRGQAVDGFSLH